MSSYRYYSQLLDDALDLAEMLLESAQEMARERKRAFRIQRLRKEGKSGLTLRPGPETPMWNLLRSQLRPHLRRYGDQVKLARLLGLPRQRVNEYVTRGRLMPDAERTLQLQVWLILARAGRRPE